METNFPKPSLKNKCMFYVKVILLRFYFKRALLGPELLDAINEDSFGITSPFHFLDRDLV